MWPPAPPFPPVTALLYDPVPFVPMLYNEHPPFGAPAQYPLFDPVFPVPPVYEIWKVPVAVPL